MFVSVPGDCHARLAMTYGGTPAPDLVSPLVMLSEVETSRRKPHTSNYPAVHSDTLYARTYMYIHAHMRFVYT